MKNLFFFLLLLVTTCSYAQNPQILKFSLENNQPRTTDNLNRLKLPLEFDFTKDFKDSSISILNNTGEILALKDGKFGAGELSLLNDTFIVVIDKDGKVNPQTNGDKKIEEKNIKLKIGNSTPIALAFDDGKTGSANESNSVSDDNYKPGYIYYDAIKLSDDKVNDAIKKKILISYGITDFKDTLSNPYLKELIKRVNEMKHIEGSDLGFGSVLTNIGNTDVTFLAAGLARFLAERTKEELNEAFFIKMKEQLNAYPELKTAFPKTTSYLDKIETFSYANILNALKDAFEMDMQNLPENLYNIKSLTDGDCDKIAICGKDKDCDDYIDCQARLKKLNEFFATQNGHWVALGMFSVKEGIRSTNPADLLKSIAASEEFTNLKIVSATNSKFDDYNIASSIELSNFISQSLVSQDDKQVWISTTQLNSLFNSKKALKIYFGLLLSKELSAESKTVINFYKSDNSKITFGDILKKAHDDYAKYEPQLSSFFKNTYAAYNVTNNAVKKMISSSEKSVEADPQALYDYYRTLTSSLNPVAHNPLLIALVGKDIGASYDKVEQFLNPSVDIAYHIATKKYSAAIYDASILLSAVNELKVTTTDKKGKTKEEKYDGFKTVTKSFVKYGTLISTVSNAQSSDEVKQALEASVLPVGSYSIKQKTSWSMSINSYVGAYWSYSNSATSKDYLPSFGLAAPVGFNISKGFSKTGNCGGLSLNIQILDVGALVNYYLLKGDTASIPNDFKVRLSNIFSPGFNLCYNIPKTPLSLAWGGQYIPTLYKYEQINETNELTPTNAWRWQLSLLVDIPMYNLKVWDFKK